MSFRLLFAMLIAAAMLFAPLAMQSGSVMAMAPADHNAQIVSPDHCADQPAKGEDGKATQKSCCAAMCTGIAVAAVTPVDPLAFPGIVGRSSPQPFQHGFLAKLPTPPPRVW